MKVKNYLLGYKDLYIYQDTSMFHFSLDSVLLPNFITISKKAKKILDIGCGNAPIPLILSTKTGASIIGVELQSEVASLAIDSVSCNHLEDRIEIMEGDINEVSKTFKDNSFDIITCNPPYFKYKEDSNVNESTYKTIARHEVYLNLEQLMQVSSKLLNFNGVLGIVHRPERLIEIIEMMRKYHIEPKKIQFVYPHPDEEANILLIEGRKLGKPGLKVLSPLYSHTATGDYTEEVKKFFEEN